MVEDTFIEVLQRLSGDAGPGGTVLISLHHWLFHFEEAGSELRKIFAEFIEWFANECPPWSAYHALMDGRLISLDKHNGVRPVGVG